LELDYLLRNSQSLVYLILRMQFMCLGLCLAKLKRLPVWNSQPQVHLMPRVWLTPEQRKDYIFNEWHSMKHAW
jgi:hypothetical protein